MKRSLAWLAVLLIAAPAFAQVTFVSKKKDYDFRPTDTFWSFNYEVGGGVGSFHDYISAVSPLGFILEGRNKVTRFLSLGLAFGYNSYSQTTDLATVLLDNGGTASGPLFRYAHLISPRFTAHYYFLDQSVQPYVGVGVGATWSFAYARVADLENADSGFHFAAHGEGGVYWLLFGHDNDSRFALNFAVRYTFTTVSFAAVQNAMMLSGLVGVVWQI